MNQTLDPYEARILQVLAFALRPLTTRQISQMSMISYNTTREKLKTLKKLKKIQMQRQANRIYWYL